MAQERVNRRLSCTFPGHHLFEHREGDVVGELAKRGDFFCGAGLLTAEIVAWKAEHVEAFALHLPLQLLEALVLRRVSALARHVHDKAHLALVLRQVCGLAVEGRRFEVVKRHGLLCGKRCYQGDRCKKRERERSGHEEILCPKHHGHPTFLNRVPRVWITHLRSRVFTPNSCGGALESSGQPFARHGSRRGGPSKPPEVRTVPMRT